MLSKSFPQTIFLIKHFKFNIRKNKRTYLANDFSDYLEGFFYIFLVINFYFGWYSASHRLIDIHCFGYKSKLNELERRNKLC